jgi:hypothetical protein
MRLWRVPIYSEGYGLTLLESMLNGTGWIANDIAAAYDLSRMGGLPGRTYTSYGELVQLLKYPPQWPKDIIENGKEFVMTMHLPADSLHSVLSVL